jgi:kinetochore protein NDC80
MKRSNSVQNFQGGAHHGRSASGSRMSLAPGRPNQPVFQRSSSGAAIYDNAPMSAQRPSASMFGSMPHQQSARKSFAPFSTSTPAHALATPGQGLDTIQRRSSIYSARPSSGPGTNTRMSFFAQAPAAAGVPVDPRRLRDPNVRGQMAQELLDYMTQNNFEMDMHMSLTSKSLSSPTQKEFNAMFKWLYNRIDPAYRFQKNIDTEVPALLKQMRYPFANSITKSQIAAVGGNNWHTFLGLLHWIMQLAIMMDSYAAGQYDEACMEAGAPVREDRIIFAFLSDAYRAWLNADEADEEAAEKAVQECVDVMAQRFKELNKDMLDDVQMLEAEKKTLMEQIEELERNAEKGRKLDIGIQTVAGDIEKFEAWNSKVSTRIKSKTQKIGLLEEDIKKVEGEIATAEQEKAGYQDALGKQGITIQDIDRMSAERERLEKSREATAARLEDSRNREQEKAVDASKRLDELERLVERYNSVCYKISLIPSTAQNAKGFDYELSLHVNSGPNFSSSQMAASLSQSQREASQEPDCLLKDQGSGYLPHHLLNLDLKGTVKNNIVSLRKEVSERRNAALEEDMRNHDFLDSVKEAMDDKQAEVEGLGHRIRAAEEEFEKTKEMTATQKMTLDSQIERMEKELGKLRTGLAESVQTMEQREINTNLE